MKVGRTSLREFLILAAVYLALTAVCLILFDHWLPRLVPFSWLPGAVLTRVVRFVLRRRGIFGNDGPDFPAEDKTHRAVHRR